MKKLSTFIIAATSFISLNVSADPLMDIIHPESADIFKINRDNYEQQGIAFANNTSKTVWSYEYEEWVNPAQYNSSLNTNSIARALEEMNKYPPAAGTVSDEIFKWDETAQEFQLQ